MTPADHIRIFTWFLVFGLDLDFSLWSNKASVNWLTETHEFPRLPSITKLIREECKVYIEHCFRLASQRWWTSSCGKSSCPNIGPLWRSSIGWSMLAAQTTMAENPSKMIQKTPTISSSKLYFLILNRHIKWQAKMFNFFQIDSSGSRDFLAMRNLYYRWAILLRFN